MEDTTNLMVVAPLVLFVKQRWTVIYIYATNSQTLHTTVRHMLQWFGLTAVNTTFITLP